jgi:hypothetical protein
VFGCGGNYTYARNQVDAFWIHGFKWAGYFVWEKLTARQEVTNVTSKAPSGFIKPLAAFS